MCVQARDGLLVVNLMSFLEVAPVDPLDGRQYANNQVRNNTIVDRPCFDGSCCCPDGDQAV